jgi:hypothetical protein
MSRADDWPFDQAPNVAAITSDAVLGGSPILVVIHYSDDDSWAFLDGGTSQPTKGRVIGMGEAAKIDPSITEVADIPPGWIARRTHVGGAWRREPDSAM